MSPDRDETSVQGFGFGLRDLVRLTPAAPGSHRVALRAGLSVAVPLLTVVQLDRTVWTAYAADRGRCGGRPARRGAPARFPVGGTDRFTRSLRSRIVMP